MCYHYNIIGIVKEVKYELKWHTHTNTHTHYLHKTLNLCSTANRRNYCTFEYSQLHKSTKFFIYIDICDYSSSLHYLYVIYTCTLHQ